MSTASKDRINRRLRSLPIFAELGDEELQTLADLVVLRKIPKGAFIVGQNEPGNAMYLLVEGRVKVSLASPDGKELALGYLDAPGHFGEMALVDAGPRSADVIAMTDVEVLSLDAKDLSRAIQVQPRLALSLIATLSHRLRNTITRLEDMAFRDARHRVMRVLLNIATAAYETQGVPVVEGFTHYEIATLAGTSRETASRVISQLAKEGAVATKGRKIIVDLFKIQEAFHSD
jgi:CRP-like cAMP-binding protein